MSKTVLVTGASTGIGRATALLLARQGFTVHAGVRKDADGEALGPAVRPLPGGQGLPRDERPRPPAPPAHFRHPAPSRPRPLVTPLDAPIRPRRRCRLALETVAIRPGDGAASPARGPARRREEIRRRCSPAAPRTS
ncbi:SDR family NAD(P)-dependent oxidoreductase [Nonomuraea phyllanthi]|uniref:SDR family NAD(P)-dependent oxidoreductase n=1 Tax=Nonomuraea phyllanthi TaxID=2219224 RepID=UPI0012939364|nr:SDR family NAD(P)-dependent oxidoreductase [Nonomuraea phyllanthi]